MKRIQEAREELIRFSTPSFTMVIQKLIFTALLLLSLFNTSHSQTLNKTKLDQFFDQLAEKNKAMGSLTITATGNTLYSRSIGFCQINGAEKKPLTTAARFRIGSITKMFTATMIFQLVDQGKLTLSDKLDTFFPQIPNATKITISQLLAHRSGIPGLADRTGKKNPKTQNDILRTIATGTPDFEPGSKYAYSNSGYIILGYIVEKLTGKSYQNALQNNICSKLELLDTYLGTGYTDTSKNECYSYRYEGDWNQEEETHLSIPVGAGAIISTATDLSKFIHGLFETELISKESLGKMKQQKLGMEIMTYNNNTFYGHAGGIDNFGSWLVYQPEEKLAIAYVANAKVYPVGNIIDGVCNIYYDKEFAIPSFESITISIDVLEKYVGVYSTPEGPVKFTVTRDGTKLFVQITNQSPFQLEPITQNRFKIESRPVEFRFNPTKNEMTIIRNGGQKVLTRDK